MPANDSTHYQTLGIAPNATEAEIRDAYRREAMKWHPDRHSSARDKEIAHLRFQAIAAAYRVLRDASLRSAYDASLRGGAQSAASGAQRGPDPSDARAQGSSAHAKQAPPDDDEQLFFEQMIDLARELTARGFPPARVAKALISLGCPESLATRAATLAGGAAKSRAERPNGQRPQGAQTEHVRQPEARRTWLYRAGRTLGEQHARSKWPSRLFWLIVTLAVWLVVSINAARHGPGFDPLVSYSLAAWSGFVLGFGFWFALAGVAALLIVAIFRSGRMTRVLAPSVAMIALSLMLSKGATVAETRRQESATPSVVTPQVQRYAEAVQRVEARLPSINPDSALYDQHVADWVVARRDFYVSKGSPRDAALMQAVADFESMRRQAVADFESARRDLAPAPQPMQQPTRAVVQPAAPRELAMGEESAINLACMDLQFQGDVLAYRRCISMHTATLQARPALPSIDRLPIGEQSAINMACNERQLAHDPLGYSDCIRRESERALR